MCAVSFRETLSVLSVLGLCVFAAGIASANASDELTCQQVKAGIEQSLRASFGQYQASILIQQGDHELVVQNFGAKVTQQSRFLIGSVTKTLHAAVAVQLLKDGLLDLEDTVGLRLPQEAASALPQSWLALKIRNLLHHTSGVPDFMNRNNPADQHTTDEFLKTAHDFLALLASVPQKLEFEPDTEFRYSNTNYLILGRILENVASLSDQDLLKRDLISPLNLANTGTLAQWDPSILGTTDIFPSNLVGLGNAYSTSSDLMAFMRALDGDRLLPQNWIEKMYQPDPACHGTNCGRYGLGFRLPAQPEVAGHRWVFHQGHLNTVSALVAKVPDLALNMSLVSDRRDFDNETLVQKYFTSLIQSGCVGLR
jgi:CubicO group peptidase (beta-lactamase class C family)